ALTVRPGANDPVIWRDLIDPGFDDIDAAGKGQGDEASLPTGIIDLDRLLGGGLPVGLTVVAGRTSMGKSGLARVLLRSAEFRHKLPCVFFSKERPRQETFKTILSAECSTSLSAINKGGLSDGDWPRAARFVGETAETPLYVDDTPAIGLPEIRAKAR